MNRYIFLVFFIASTCFGQIISPSNVRTLKQFKNYVLNPDAEYNNKADIDDSSGILTVTSSNPINGRYKFAIDATSLGQKVRFKLNALPNKFKGESGECTLRYQVFSTPSSTAEYKYYIETSTSVKLSPELSLPTVDSLSTPAPLNFFNTGSTIFAINYLVIESTLANSAPIYVDDLHCGEITSIGQFSSESGWQSYTPTFNGVTAASVNFQWRKDGPDILIVGYGVANSPAATDFFFTLPNNYQINTNVVSTNGQIVGDFTTNNNSANFSYAPIVVPSANLTRVLVGLKAAAADNQFSPRAATSIFVSGNTFSFNVRVPIQGWSASQAGAAANQTDYGWTAYTPTFTGFGTVTNSECKHRRNKEDLDVECKFTVGTPTATEARVSFPNSLTGVTLSQGIKLAGLWVRGASDANKGGVVLVESGTGYFVFSDANVFGSGTTNAVTKANGSGMTSSGVITLKASVQIAGWAENQRAPTLIGSVTSDDVRALRYEYAKAASCAASPCTTTDKSSGVSSVTRTGTGTYSINFTPSYSVAPTCTCDGGTGGTARICTAAGTSHAVGAIEFKTTNSSNSGTEDNGFTIHCIGPR